MDDLHTYGYQPLNHRGDDDRAPKSGFSRREFLVTTLAAGFALAAQPVSADAIKTDSKGLVAGAVDVPVAGGKIPAYRAYPAKAGVHPTVVVIQEIFGVHEYIQDVCRRLAKQGYFAIAPDLFTRQGDVSKISDVNQILTEVVSKVPDEQVFSDLDAAVAFAKASGKANTARLGVVGFCYGGRIVWLYANHNPKVKAGVGFYGLLSGLKSDIKLNDPVDIAAKITVPVLGLMAGADTYITAATVDQMQAELRKGSTASEIVVIPGVSHGFHADYRPSYDKTAAEYGWKLASNWLKDHGV